MTKKELKKKAMEQFLSRKEYSRLVDAALNNKAFDYEKAEDNYLAAYAIARGIYEHHTNWMVNGSSYKATNMKVKRWATAVYNTIFRF